MPTSSQKRLLNYNADDLFNIVIDIEKYPDFIPWCSEINIINKKKNQIIADLKVSYKLFNETFRSYVKYNKKNLIITVEYTEGPLESLNTNWKFSKINNKKTFVHFDINLQFKVGLFNKILNIFFKNIEEKMIDAFENRAYKILNN